MIKKGFIVLILCLLAYSFFVEPGKLQVVRYNIENSSLRGIKLVLIGDFHVKSNDYTKLRQITKTVNAENPDVVLSVGDFINGYKADSTMPIEKIAERLSLIHTRNNFFTVLGEHDVKSGKEEVINALTKYSIRPIENTNRRVIVKGRVFYVAGVEDISAGKPDINKALRGTKAPVILLSHSPDIFPQVPTNVAITLAGHTHGGQIHVPPFRPLIMKSKYSDRYIYGLVEEEGKKMVVTRGIGTSDIPARFNCPPEIVVINFI